MTNLRKFIISNLIGAFVAFGLLIVAAGDDIEAYLNPVIKDVTIHNVRVTDDSRLCFLWRGEKSREAEGIFYAAAYYVGEDTRPLFKGIEHFSREPFGGGRHGAPPGRFESDTCLHIHPSDREAARLKVRIFTEYTLPYRLWRLRQFPISVDAYKGVNY